MIVKSSNLELFGLILAKKKFIGTLIEKKCLAVLAKRVWAALAKNVLGQLW
jgi:hypothetical protein